MVNNYSNQPQMFPHMEAQSTVINGSTRCHVSNYLKTREALWRMLASYPSDMQVTEALSKARVDFTKVGKEVAV